jgi:hypothetical protein
MVGCGNWCKVRKVGQKCKLIILFFSVKKLWKTDIKSMRTIGCSEVIQQMNSICHFSKKWPDLET